MRALARVAAEADGRGGTRLAVLHGEAPLLLRRTGGRGGPGVSVHLVGGAAGPLRGDELRLELTVGSGAELEIRSVAAQLALPGRSGLPASRYDIQVSVAAGGVLRWLPEPLIAAAGCDHLTSTHVEVAEGGSVLWRDDLVCGRHREESGDVQVKTIFRYGGSTVYRHDLAVGPRAPGWSGAAVLGAGRAIGTLVVLGPAITVPPMVAANPLVGEVATMPLAGPGVLATAVGMDIRQVRAALGPLCDPLPAPAELAPAL